MEDAMAVTVERKGAAMKDREAFFYENAGYSWDPSSESREEGRRKCARYLAEAEERAKKKQEIMTTDLEKRLERKIFNSIIPRKLLSPLMKPGTERILAQKLSSSLGKKSLRPKQFFGTVPSVKSKKKSLLKGREQFRRLLLIRVLFL